MDFATALPIDELRPDLGPEAPAAGREYGYRDQGVAGHMGENRVTNPAAAIEGKCESGTGKGPGQQVLVQEPEEQGGQDE